MSDAVAVLDDLDDLEANSAILEDELDFEIEEEDEVSLLDFDALGIDPLEPTGAKPGSEAKVMMLAARYAAGLPLWHNSDCYDHGPGGMLPEELAEAL